MVESFKLDHTKVVAPYVRLAELKTGPKGDVVSKFDLRLMQPNKEAIPTAAIHSLEHLFAVKVRELLPEIIDISPMGCRTGFYMLAFGQHDLADIEKVFEGLLESAAQAEKIEATTAVECGHFRDHSLFSAREYAAAVLEAFKNR